MSTYFEYKHKILSSAFQYTRKQTVDEREIHTYHEILYYIDGEATILCESFSKKLTPNSIILIPKGCYHFLKCEKPENFERLKISFTHIEGFEKIAESTMRSIRVLEKPDSDILALLKSVCKRLKRSDGENQSAFLFGALMILLSSLDENSKLTPNDTRDTLITATIEYIEANLSSPLNTDTVAEAMKVSPSTLSHTFKREIGIPLHKYVTQKRMILAKRLIDGDCQPTKIYADCGFGDYSSFYKAFVSYFGHSPSSKKS